ASSAAAGEVAAARAMACRRALAAGNHPCRLPAASLTPGCVPERHGGTLDEVFNALDFGSTLYLREHLRERVRRDALTIVLATHSLDIVCRCCDGFVLLQDGRMAGRWDTAGLPSGDRLQAIEQVLAAAAAPRSQAG